MPHMTFDSRSSLFVSIMLAVLTLALGLWEIFVDARDPKKTREEKRLMLGRGLVAVVALVAFIAKTFVDIGDAIDASELSDQAARTAQVETQRLQKENDRMRFLVAAQGNLSGLMVTWHLPNGAMSAAIEALRDLHGQGAPLLAALRDGVVVISSPRIGPAKAVMYSRDGNNTAIQSCERESNDTNWPAVRVLLTALVSDEFTLSLASGENVVALVGGDPAGIDEIRIENETLTLILNSTAIRRSTITNTQAIRAVMADPTRTITPDVISVVAADSQVMFNVELRANPTWTFVSLALESAPSGNRSTLRRDIATLQSPILSPSFAPEFLAR